MAGVLCVFFFAFFKTTNKLLSSKHYYSSGNENSLVNVSYQVKTGEN